MMSQMKKKKRKTKKVKIVKIQAQLLVDRVQINKLILILRIYKEMSIM